MESLLITRISSNTEERRGGGLRCLGGVATWERKELHGAAFCNGASLVHDIVVNSFWGGGRVLYKCDWINDTNIAAVEGPYTLSWIFYVNLEY